MTTKTDKPKQKTNKSNAEEIITWSASSWQTWKTCPLKWYIKSQRWANPTTKPDRRTAIYAIPGLVIDRLFELWLYRGKFNDMDWLEDNFDMVFRREIAKKKPKFKDKNEQQAIYTKIKASVRALYDLLHKQNLIGERVDRTNIGIQTEFHELITDRIAIVGAVDFWCIRDDGKVFLVDFKYAKVDRWQRRSIDQLHFYSMALETILGSPPDNIIYMCFDADNPGSITRPYRRCDSQKLIARLERASDLRTSGNHSPRFHPYYCGKFCDIRFGCQVFRDAIGK